MPDLSAFSPDYWTAREKFRAAARAAGAALTDHVNPAAPPPGHDAKLTTDVAVLGPGDAGLVLLVNAGTHGVEAFAGSAIEIAFLASRPALPDDTRLVLVHAINPHGFAWLRRVTEDNVDLNRNFLDHGGPHPANEAYGKIHKLLCPERWDEPTLAEMGRTIDAYIEKHGAFALQAVVTRGQYDHADGLFYGGRRPVWSNATFRAILDAHVAGARRVAFIDLHTGLGGYGDAELIGGAGPSTPGGRRMRDWYGDIVTSPASGTSSSAPLTGVIARAVREAADGAEVISGTLEFGTYPVREVLHALQADNWLHVHGEVDSPLGRVIKADIRKRLFPDEDSWKERVLDQGLRILDRTLEGLGGG
ncbi:MAG: M14 family metallopeptidase [Defluviicoccus sp.]|nr:M14 family metallopeptidase [Defluviicoccus sp.]